MNNNCRNNVIEPQKILKITNNLRFLGLKFNMSGTKFISKCIQIIILSGSDIYFLEDVINEIIKIYPRYNSMQIRMAMKYALENRDDKKSKQNFEKIFGYQYSEEIFVTKTFIDEFIYTIV